MNILLIEPNTLISNQYVGYLSQQGHEITSVSDAQEAILAADKQAPDLVIMEPLLAAHSGIEFLYEFRSYSEWQNIPVIILSRVQAGKLGLNDKNSKELKVTALYKPEVSLQKLAAAVERATA